MTPEEFVNKTKKLLGFIEREYSQCWVNRRLNEEEMRDALCDECEGECKLIIEGKEVDCIADRIEGECYVRQFDRDLFVELMENMMFEEKDFWDLLKGEI